MRTVAVCFCCVPCKPRGSHRTPSEEGPHPPTFSIDRLSIDHGGRRSRLAAHALVNVSLSKEKVGGSLDLGFATISRNPRHDATPCSRLPLATIAGSRLAPGNGVRTFLVSPVLGESRPSGSLKTAPRYEVPRIGMTIKEKAPFVNPPSRGALRRG